MHDLSVSPPATCLPNYDPLRADGRPFAAPPGAARPLVFPSPLEEEEMGISPIIALGLQSTFRSRGRPLKR